MKKTKCINNCQNYTICNNTLTQKKLDKNNSSIPLQENINNNLFFKSENSGINIPSQISSKEKIFPENYQMTPFKKINNINSSSNKYKNFSSSGSIWKRSKNFNNNINEDNYAKRKLFLSNMSAMSNLTNINPKQNYDFIFENFLNNENNTNNNININSPLFITSKNINTNNNNEPNKENKKNLEKENNMDNKGTNINKLFFTEYGLGYKCNCTKTGCNKNYCECFNQGRYCHGCNCQNCQNKIPENILCNKRPKEKEEKIKNILITCTCTKSGCNKNYCECYKNKMKCNSQCRCINCENFDNEKSESLINNLNNSFNKKYQCCQANSIFIIKNKITIDESSKKNRKIKIKINEELSESSSSLNKNIGMKRKRDDKILKSLSNKKSKISEENTNESLKGKKNDFSESDLFDKEGKLILTYIKL